MVVWTRYAVLLVGFSAAAWLSTCAAAEVEAPRGIYVAYGRELNDRILQAPYLTGVLVRAHWREVEPAEGRFDWAPLRRDIELARKHGKKVTLALAGGPATPDWVYAAGAQAFEYTFMNPHSPRGGRSERIPLPWDSVFIAKWTNTIAALGREFGSDPAVTLVHITGSSKNGFELQLPEERGRTPGERGGRWIEVGFTAAQFEAGWKSVIEAFGRSFPGKALDLEIHPVLGDSEIPRRLAKYGYDRLGKRFGTFGGWLSGKPRAWDTDLRDIMMEQSRLSFSNYQLIANETRQPDRLGPGGLIGAIRTGIAEGARYFEIWEADAKNPQFDDALLAIRKELLSN
jgi:hypothetical protein